MLIRGASPDEEAAAREEGRREVIEFARNGEAPAKALSQIEELKRQLATASRNPSSSSASLKQMRDRVTKLEEQAKKAQEIEVCTILIFIYCGLLLSSIYIYISLPLHPSIYLSIYLA